MISGSIKRQVALALADAPKKANVAKLAVDLAAGVNVVYAYRPAPTSPWTVEAYIGSNWKGKVQGGVEIVWAR